jgi:N-acetylglutamate synthase-like GNAT family acetyltransferase
LSLLVEPASNTDLPLIYSLYFQVFNQSPLQEVSSSGNRNVGKLSFPKAYFLNLFHLLLDRLFNASRGSLKVLFDKKGDMILNKVVYNKEIVGFCFLKKHNSKVFEIGIIAIKDEKRDLGLGSHTIACIKSKAKEEGATRLIVRASGIKHAAGFFERCGFKQAFQENIYLLNIDNSDEGALLTS